MSSGGVSMKIEAMQAQLSKIERQRQSLERQIQALQEKRLAALPGQVGLSSIDGLILALLPHASSSLRGRLQGIEPEGHGVSMAVNGNVDGRRMRFPESVKEQVKAELQKGGKSVAQISRECGPSHPTIMGWKREWGMTRPRPKKSAPR